MRAQIMFFDGPRSPELLAAADHAGRDRVTPTLLGDPQLAAGHIATYVLRQPDGTDLAVVVARDEETLDRAGQLLGATPLLPDEDPALLPGPDRVERYEVIFAAERGQVVDDAAPAPA